MNKDLKDQLAEVLSGEVEDEESKIKDYKHDASIFEVQPELVCFPKDTKDVESLVNFVRKNHQNYPGLSITARSGGTDMTGGPLNSSVIVDFAKHFNAIGSIKNNKISFQPGVFYHDFNAKTAKKNLLLPSYPASREICTLGGMVSNNSGGERTLKYGKIQDYVRKLKVVLSDGKEHTVKPLSGRKLNKKLKEKGFEGKIYKKIYKLLNKYAEDIRRSKPSVSKNSAGYNIWDAWNGTTLDLTKLIVGAQGTLGLITEAEASLVERKPHSGLVVIFLYDINSVTDLVGKVLDFEPTSFESFDDKTLKLALKFFPSLLKLMGSKNVFSLAFKFLPEFWMVLRHGVPKLVMLVEFEEDMESTAQEKTMALSQVIDAMGVKNRIASGQADIKKYFLIRRESFNLLRNKMRNRQASPFIDDIIVSPEKISVFWPSLTRILDKYDLIYTIAGHIGDGNFHIIPLMKLKSSKERSKIKPLMDEVYEMVLKYKGSLTAEHNDGLIRSPYLEQMYGKKTYKIFKEIKNIFDPDNIFNPGKKVGGDIKYALDHIKRNK